MTTADFKKDLIVLVADRNMEFTVRGLLNRRDSLGIREISHDIYKHPWHDAGCRSNGVNFLRPFVNQYRRALLMFDKEGCGQENRSRTDLETSLESDLTNAGWSDRAAAIVIDPELENWVWSDSPHVNTVIGWEGAQQDLRQWLIQQGHLLEAHGKPQHPKETMIAALRHTQIAHSSALFYQLAERVSFERCADSAFLKFKSILQTWFLIA